MEEARIRTPKISIDLDSPTGIMVFRAWYGLQRCGYLVSGRISASGNGIHLMGIMPQFGDIRETYDIRRFLGDDPKRVYFDESAPPGKPQAILFDEKKGKYASEWIDDILQLIDSYGALV